MVREERRRVRVRPAEAEDAVEPVADAGGQGDGSEARVAGADPVAVADRDFRVDVVGLSRADGEVELVGPAHQRDGPRNGACAARTCARTHRENAGDQPGGLEIATRGGLDPRASVSLWKKMQAASGEKSGMLSFLSTHPSAPNRIRKLEANVPKVRALYERASKG